MTVTGFQVYVINARDPSVPADVTSVAGIQQRRLKQILMLCFVHTPWKKGKFRAKAGQEDVSSGVRNHCSSSSSTCYRS